MGERRDYFAIDILDNVRMNSIMPGRTKSLTRVEILHRRLQVASPSRFLHISSTHPPRPPHQVYILPADLVGIDASPTSPEGDYLIRGEGGGL